MGRYSSVQTYSDQQNTRSTTYEQERATGGTLQTEKVYNPYGSTAGAGSGEFHIYRHARAREQQRLKALDEAEQDQTEAVEFQQKVQEWKAEEEKRLEKKRKKRAREKAAKLRKKNLVLSGVTLGSEGNRGDVDDHCDVDSNDEFTYEPVHSEVSEDKNQASVENKTNQQDREDEINDSHSSESKQIGAAVLNDSKPLAEPTPPPFKNDGSFLEMMKKKQQEKEGKKVPEGST
mmetsp:Transcript_12169/g.22800  ORF Transcript_12169/g.22800 Transcript_12169/m.22800 type:complete len:233 (-) Transcript_12169:98-796(-)